MTKTTVPMTRSNKRAAKTYKNRKWTYANAVFGILLLIAAPAHAYRVSPLSIDLIPQSGKRNEVIRVENTTARNLTLEIKVAKRSVDATGRETTVPAEDDFVILPPQGALKPGAAQAFRLEYAGATALNESAAYVVTVVQLPVDLPERRESGIDFLVNFGVNVYVNPKDAKADIQATNVRPSQGAGLIELDVENRGNRALSLGLGEWVVRNTKGAEARVGPGQLSGMEQSFLMPAGFKRKFQLRVPEDFDRSGALTAAFTPAKLGAN